MKTYRFEVEFVETNCGPEPHVCRRAWSGSANSKQEAMEKCAAWFGFEQDDIEVTDWRDCDEDLPPEEEER